jgi:hypothetical protein
MIYIHHLDLRSKVLQMSLYAAASGMNFVMNTLKNGVEVFTGAKKVHRKYVKPQLRKVNAAGKKLKVKAERLSKAKRKSRIKAK